MNEPAEVVRDHLSRGVTGCLELCRADGAELQLYVMQGEIIAAHSPDDGPAVVQRMLNGGAISQGLAREIRQALASGASFEGELLGRVPEDLFLDLLVQRFRQNVLDFISSLEAPRFTPLEAVFVENIQTGHDSMELLSVLTAQRDTIAELLADRDRVVVRPGTAAPRRQVHARLLDLSEPEIVLGSLMDLSPFEDGATVTAIVDMAASGVVVLGEPSPREQPELEIEEGSIIPELEEETAEVPPLDLGLSALDSAALEPLSDVHETLEPLDDLYDDDPEDDDPEVAHAIRRAQEIEARRAAAREDMERDEAGDVTTTPPAEEAGGPPPGFEWYDDGPDTDGAGKAPPGFDFLGGMVGEDEMAFFEDQDKVRGRGDGAFSTENDMLDRVDLSEEGMEAFQRAMGAAAPEPPPAQHDIIEMGEATAEEARGAVALNFTGPQLDEHDILEKLDVVNDVLAHVARALDESTGRGSGRVGLQLLVDGPPSKFAVVFRGVQVDDEGHMDTRRILRNLRKRPESEHRQLLRESMLDLIQRTLSASVESMEDELIDDMLENIAGYQQRMGL
ncbi:MAG: hypothetical protein H6742_19930 [Alphaproteobacteria bacterium]|nr:hypothetical protein [Alphaproteobacteria bacterium]